jgi:aminopeptidase N
LGCFTACVVPAAESAVDDPPQPIIHTPTDRGYDVLSYGLDLELHAERPELQGTTRIRLRTTRALDSLVFDASDMEILEVSTELSRIELLPFISAKRTITIPLASEVQADEVLSLDISYRTSPLAGMHFSLPGQSGVDHVPHVFTQGEAQRSRFWFPCNDDPADRATHTLRARVPRSWVTVAAGELVGHELDATGMTVLDTWVLDQEMPTYLFTFAAGPFLKLEDRWEDVELWYVGEPQDVDSLSASFEETAEILGFLSDYTGFRYPFKKYAQVAVRDFPFGGMENVTATTVTRNALHDAAHQASNPSWGLVAHEAAHQWFGDIVTCIDWTHAWLNEGFATYGNLLYRRHREGEGAFQVAMGQTVDRYARACRGENLRPLVKSEYRLPMDLFFDGTIYPGGAARANLFRGILGEETFREALQIYLHRNAYRSVHSDDLRIALEDASGRDLTETFRQWVYAPGYPELDLSWTRRGRELQVHVTQMQSIGGGVPAAFHFPLDVRWYENGQWRETRFQVTQEDQVFQVDTGPDFDGWIEFDPHVYLPATMVIHERAASTRQRALQAWSARCRVLALRDLADYRDAETTEVLWHAARRDPVPGVRREAIGVLRKRSAGETPELARLRSSFASEQDASNRAAWWSWIATTAGTPVTDSLLRETLDSKDALTGLRVTAYRALAAQLLPAARLRFAQDQLGKDSGEGQRLHLAALGTIGGLGKQDSQGALGGEIRAILLPYSWTGNSTPIRSAALGHLKVWLADIDAVSPSASDLALMETYRKALRSYSAPLRRAGAGAVGDHQSLFKAEIRALLARDPDARNRRLLED